MQAKHVDPLHHHCSITHGEAPMFPPCLVDILFRGIRNARDVIECLLCVGGKHRDGLEDGFLQGGGGFAVALLPALTPPFHLPASVLLLLRLRLMWRFSVLQNTDQSRCKFFVVVVQNVHLDYACHGFATIVIFGPNRITASERHHGNYFVLLSLFC